MKFECALPQLIQAVTKLQRVTSKNQTLPVLSSILFVAEKAKIILRATNLEIGIEFSIPCKVSKEGQAAIPADTLRSLLGSLGSDGKVMISTQGNVATLETVVNQAHINLLDHAEFPSIPYVDSGAILTLSSSILVSAFKNVFYSASTSTIKPELSSVYVYPVDEEFVSAATDSFRLAERRERVKKLKQFDPFLIPAKNVAEVIRVFSEEQADIIMHLTPNQVAFATDQSYVTSRLIEGVFPDYRQIIPKEYETKATILKSDFERALKLSSVFIDRFNQIIISVDISQKQLIIETTNAEVGANTSTVVANVEGEPVTMKFNHHYVLDVLQSIITESIDISLGVGKPMMIKPHGKTGFMYLVMPMHQ